ncbi:tetratricopeptide repeat protein [Microcoleus sp. FACHB-1515]|uniref:tetratricopeptide repeat protein n=1 Tax=Cyanophyceae TaxID=3028117 RepID=UPI001682B990|nr:tetratricopeptide repeat protein [Microcoleus sp. FACHB-1515]MBD2089388.1 tetratricopeptide repeat protein [Microcoleus sp. FACHB-1515]
MKTHPLAIAQQHHQAKRYAEAALHCRQLLKQQPRNAAALHLLAMSLHKAGDLTGAIEQYQNLLKLRPQDVQTHNNLGVALKVQGNLTEAEQHYRQAIALDPQSAGAYNNLGNLLKQQGRLDEAAAAYQQAIHLAPNYLDAQASLGQVWMQQGKLDAAAEHFRHLLTLHPDNPDLHNHLGNTLQKLDRFAEAIPHYETAIARQPAPSYYNNLGAALQDLGRSAEAIAVYQQALTLDSNYPDAYYNLGNALKDLTRYTDCVKVYQRAIELAPRHAEAHNNLGLVLYELGRLEAAIAVYEQAIELRTNYPDAHLNMALSLLAAGDLERGFQEYEWRWQVKGKNFKPMRSFLQPLWDGSDPTGKTILLHAEQGFGDTIQFIRYVPLVAAKGGRVIVECQPPLARLLQTVPEIAQVIPAGSPLPEFDVHLPLLSLPDRFRTSLQTIPCQTPYLQPPEAAPLQLTGSPKVGIVWAGSPDNANDRQRSCPFETFADLLNVPGIVFFSLQKGERSIDLQAVSGVTDLSEHLRDFADTAAAIARLDLVITVDTAVSHLTGALGKPVWVLLSFAPDWRWMRDRLDSPWYSTARLFRQPAPGDWASVISQAKTALEQWRSRTRSSSDFQASDFLTLGNALRRQGKLQEAIAAYRQSIALSPKPTAFNNLGVTLRQCGDQAGAIACYQQALKLNPSYVDTRFNLGNALKDQDDLMGAIEQYRLAIALKPNQPNVWVNLGNALKAQGKLAEAIECYRHVLAIDPQNASAHNNLGQALLQAGDWLNGFAENEWRWRVENYAWPRPPLPQPRWDGSDLTGKTILLYAEQGFGDTIQFIRYAPLVAAKGGRVIVECQPPLVRLLQTVSGIEKVIPRGEPLPEFDFQIPLLSLPHRFGTSIQTAPAEIPYLQPPASSIALPESTGLKVGIAWAGSPTNRGDRYRSCGIDRFLPLLEIPGIAFYSLQKGAEVADERIINLDLQLGDFADTASAIAQLDLVITVDTAVAHLAGALGKPVWVLLCFDPDWRWMRESVTAALRESVTAALRDRTDSPWYPTARLFRQTKPGDWETVFANVAIALRQKLGEAVSVKAIEPVQKMQPLAIGWQLSAATGWGVYGTNLAIHLQQNSHYQPVLLLPPATSAPFNPLQQALLQPIFANRPAKFPTRLDFPILKGLGNQFGTAPEIDRIQGSHSIGVIFFEDAKFSPNAIARAHSYDALIAGSSWNASVMRHHGLTRVYTVLQGIDPTLFHPAPKSGQFKDRFVIFSGGKLEYRKGQDIVVRTFREFHARHPDALLVTAWHNFWAKTIEGIDRAGHVSGIPTVTPDGKLQLAEWLVANGVPATAFIDLGVIPNSLTPQILREADVALFPNRCEGGTNLAAMECLACGVPTVLSANTGHLDLIGDHCYPLRNQSPVQGIGAHLSYEDWGESDVEEILAVLESIYANRAEAQCRGSAAAKFMQDWSWDRQLDRLLDAIGSMTS